MKIKTSWEVPYIIFEPSELKRVIEALEKTGNASDKQLAHELNSALPDEDTDVQDDD